MLQRSIIAVFKKLTSGEPVKVHKGSGLTFADVGPPGLLLLDVS